MPEVTATRDEQAKHWRGLASALPITEFRYAVEQSRAVGVSWDGGAVLRRTLSGIEGSDLDLVGSLIEKLAKLAEGRLL